MLKIAYQSKCLISLSNLKDMYKKRKKPMSGLLYFDRIDIYLSFNIVSVILFAASLRLGSACWA